MKKVLLIALSSLMLLGCQQKIRYTDFRSFPVYGWEADSVCVFTPTIEDFSVCDVQIVVRHTDKYAYQNLWLFVEVKKDSVSLRKDTIESFLANDKGEWYGAGMRLYEIPLLYLQSYNFQSEGIYEISIQHAMRSDSLLGIMDVGVKIIEQKN